MLGSADLVAMSERVYVESKLAGLYSDHTDNIPHNVFAVTTNYYLPVTLSFMNKQLLTGSWPGTLSLALLWQKLLACIRK